MSSTYDKLNQVKKRLQEHPTSIQELADYMNCNIRTIYRYITTLEGENCGLKQDKKTHRFFISPEAPGISDSRTEVGAESLGQHGCCPRQEHQKGDQDFER